MARIVNLDDHRREREPGRGVATSLSPGRPQLSDRDLWTRDYKEPDNVLYAILKIKEILDYHLYLSKGEKEMTPAEMQEKAVQLFSQGLQ